MRVLPGSDLASVVLNIAVGELMFKWDVLLCHRHRASDCLRASGFEGSRRTWREEPVSSVVLSQGCLTLRTNQEADVNGHIQVCIET